MQGIANAQSNLMLDKLHELQLAQMASAARGNGTHQAKRHAGGHGRLLEMDPTSPGLQLEDSEASSVSPVGVRDESVMAAAELEDAAPHRSNKVHAEAAADAQLRGTGKAASSKRISGGGGRKERAGERGRGASNRVEHEGTR